MNILFVSATCEHFTETPTVWDWIVCAAKGGEIHCPKRKCLSAALLSACDTVVWAVDVFEVDVLILPNASLAAPYQLAEYAGETPAAPDDGK